MAGMTKQPGQGTALPGQQQGQGGADPASLYSADMPVTQGDLFNLQQQQGRKAAPVFSGGGGDMSGRLQAMRQMLAAGGGGGGGGGKERVRQSARPPEMGKM